MIEQLLDGFFEEEGVDIHKQYDEDGDTLYLCDVDLECGMFDLCIVVSEESQTVTVLIDSPIKIPEPKRSAIAEYLAYANYHFFEGSLILGFTTGQLGYKYCMRFNPEEDISHIKYQLHVSLSLGIDEMEKHFPGITSVIYSDVEPEEAFQKAEFGSNAWLN